MLSDRARSSCLQDRSVEVSCLLLQNALQEINFWFSETWMWSSNENKALWKLRFRLSVQFYPDISTGIMIWKTLSVPNEHISAATAGATTPHSWCWQSAGFSLQNECERRKGEMTVHCAVLARRGNIYQYSCVNRKRTVDNRIAISRACNCGLYKTLSEYFLRWQKQDKGWANTGKAHKLIPRSHLCWCFGSSPTKKNLQEAHETALVCHGRPQSWLNRLGHFTCTLLDKTPNRAVISSQSD